MQDIKQTAPLRVLVVDEHTESSEVVADHLESRGHAVRSVSSNSKAMRVAMELRPHVAIIDIGLGDDPTSYALARQLLLLPGLEKLRLVAVTGYASRDVEADAKAAGVDFFRCLTKPLNPSALLSAIENS